MKAASKKSSKKKSTRSNSSSSKKTTSTGGSSLPSNVLCLPENDAVLNTMVGRVIRDTIFPKKQFVRHEQELESNSRVATKCLKALNMEQSQWHLVKNLVRVRLNRKRNNAQLGVRRSLHRKYSVCIVLEMIVSHAFVSLSTTGYMKVHGPDSIQLSQVLEGRKNKQVFYWFLEEIATVVVGSVYVERVNCTMSPVEWLSPSLEAFSLLCVENFYDRVKSQVNNEDPIRKAKWTEGRGCKKFQGWSEAGIVRYNELIEQVREDRKTYSKVDEGYLKKKKEELMKYESEKLKKKQEASGRTVDIVTAHDDLSSDDDNDDGSDDDEVESDSDTDD